MRAFLQKNIYVPAAGLAIMLGILLLQDTLPLSSMDTSPEVLNGIDVLREKNFSSLAGKRVGLITNHTGLAADGNSTIDLFFRSSVFDLVALFSPEHGIRGNLDGRISSSVDESTRLPIFSLYGETRRPMPEMLEKIDVLVFDIQDIGARFFTYATTMAYCMEAAAEARIPFYVLDRPNPIGGLRVEGPMLDANRTSFVGYMPLPVRHGMTIGELARYFNTEGNIGVDLQVVAMDGWKRSYYFWDTGQLWVNPSPNMRNMLGAVLYPGVCLLEGTNVSVGRGTDRPFELVGAPWIEPHRFAASLRHYSLDGVDFVPIYFVPNASKNRGMRCGGVNLLITDVGNVAPVRLGMTLILVLHKLYPEDFEMSKIIGLLGNAEAMRQLEAGKLPLEMLETDNAAMREFMNKRRKALIYGQTAGLREER